MTNELLAFRRLGEQGPDLICLHGLYGSGRNWLSIARQLAQDYRVWLPDLRNHGKSFHDPAWDYQVMAADVARLAAAEGIDRFALMGHSMGGKVAMQFALDQVGQPDQPLSHLILVDIAPKPYAAAYHHQLLANLAGLDLANLSSREQADQALTAAIPEAAVRGFLLSNLSRGESGFYWQFNLPVLRQKLDLITENISGPKAFCACPVLFVAGADSDYIRQQDLPTIKTFFPEAQCRWIEGAGHWVHTDQPQALLDLLQRFLQTGQA